MRTKGLFLLALIALLGTLLGCGEPEPTPTPAPTPTPMPTATPTPAPLAADLISYLPQDTAFMMTVQLHPQEGATANWRRIRDAFASIPEVQEGLEEMALDLQEMPFDWETDLEPWMGDSMVMALTSWDPMLEEMGAVPLVPQEFEGQEPDPSQVPMLFALQVSDPQGYASFVETMEAAMAAEGLALQENTMGGTTVYTISDEEMNLTFGLHNDSVLLLSPHLPTLEAAMQQVGGSSLADNQTFQDLIGQLPQNQVMAGYVDTVGLMAGMAESLGESGVSLPMGLTQMSQGLAFAAVPEADGLRFEAITRIDWDAAAEAGLADYYEQQMNPLPARSLDFIPQQAAFVVANFAPGGLQTVWEMQMQQMQQIDPQAYDEIMWGLSDFAEETGLDVEEDILSWMTGEFAIFLAPPEQPGAMTAAGIPAFEMGIIIEVGDRAKAEATMEQLENLMLQEGIVFYEQEIDGVPVRVASDLEMLGYLPGYAFIDDFLLIAIDGPSFRAAIAAQQNESNRLVSAPGFRTANEYLPRPSTGVFFLDMVRLTNFLDNVLEEPELSDFREEVRPVLDLFGGLAAAGQVGEEYSTSAFFVHILP